ncbi:MAG TPA: hypothetical protein VFP65_04445 [Anaeromyxobacteraceae bacterium]|nr:hypothetical protein [Anaeromyxobacteraceae bacterium]
MALLSAVESPDCWRLIGEDDLATPPSVSRVLSAVGTRDEWRRAGFPVLFGDDGSVRHVVRGGRVYRFEPVDRTLLASARHPEPRAG